MMFFSKNNRQEGTQDEDEAPRRGGYRTMTQMKPEEVMETLKHVVRTEGVSKMSIQELSQFLMKLTRATYISP
jgi:hypothetical protein